QPSSGARSRSAPAGVPITWDVKVFSNLLREAVDRHDFHRGDSLVSSLTEHVQVRPDAYPAGDAATDLDTLRQARQFSLMRRYGEAALRSGVTDFTVRRLYAQALIEQG